MDVHHIFDVFHVPEGKFNRLNLASLTTATNYFRPTRILYCIDRLSEVASLFFIIVYRLICLKVITKSAIF